MHQHLRRTLLTCFVLLLGCLPLYAAITGSISGNLVDPSGAAIPGAQVTVRNEATGVTQVVTTDGSGFYTFPALNVGVYTITTAPAGFRTYETHGIKVDANSAIRIDISVQVGATNQVQEVTADALQVETQTTQLGQVIESTKMTSVPLNGRSFTDLLSLQPGVSPYKGTSEAGRTVSGDLDPGNVSINGGREASNGYMINGADANEGVYNGAAIIPNLDSIAEFRILTNNFDAEYGNFSGGEINVVTKSGTNRFHGNAFDFYGIPTSMPPITTQNTSAASSFRTSSGVPWVALSARTRPSSSPTTRGPSRSAAQRRTSPYLRRRIATAPSIRETPLPSMEA